MPQLGEIKRAREIGLLANKGYDNMYGKRVWFAVWSDGLDWQGGSP